MAPPSTMKSYNVKGKDGFDSVVYNDKAAVPKVGDKDVLVKIEGISLNYRDLIIPQGKYPFGVRDGVVPCSDGAGTVEQVGAHVTRFKPGDKVVTLFNQAHLYGELDAGIRATGLGGSVDGTLREYAAFNEQGLVHSPKNLNALQSATLTCAGLTAWNALYGLTDKTLKPGDTVVVQGTGGVSLFALQFAKAAGATVIATTSSDAKKETLQKLGADHVLNYKTTPTWGEEAKKLTGGRGVDHVLEVGGPTSMKQSIAAIAMGGVISIIGFLGGFKAEDQPTFLDCLSGLFIVRGVLVGSRKQMEDMVKAIETHPETLKPVVDKTVFSLEQAKEAYQYMWDQKHFGKLCIKVE